MFNKIIAWSVTNKLYVMLLTIALIIYGTFSLGKLPIDAVPDITNNQVQVITIAPSLGATDIERLVTFPIELANSNISGLKEIRSFSRFGLSLVTIVFDDGIDIYNSMIVINRISSLFIFFVFTSIVMVIYSMFFNKIENSN